MNVDLTSRRRALGTGFFARVASLFSVAVLVGVACTSGGSDDSGATEATDAPVETTEPDDARADEADDREDSEAEDEGRFSEAPAVVVSARTPNRLAQRDLDGGVPSWYLENPLAKQAESGVAEEPEDVTVTYGSPDGRYLAFGQDPTAAKPGRFDVVSVETGDMVSAVEYEGQRFTDFLWSPDGRALAFRGETGIAETSIYLHRVDGATTVAEVRGSVARSGFSSDDSGSALALCGQSQVVVATVGDVPGDVAQEISVADCRVLQVFDEAGDPLALVRGREVLNADQGNVAVPRLHRLDPSGELIELPIPAGLTTATSEACNGLVASPTTLGGPGAAETLGWVYSPVRDAFVTLPELFDSRCPIPSPDGAKFAVHPDDESVVVGDFATGEVVEVARAGRPVAWSADGARLLVEGNGTFVVEADGSGAIEASEQASREGFSCRAPETGHVVLRTEDGLVLFDVGEDAGTLLLPADSQFSDGLSGGCTITPDGRWLLAGFLLVDLEQERATKLPSRDGTTGRIVDEEGGSASPLTGVIWYGEQDATSTL